jgi:hypothetical protein
MHEPYLAGSRGSLQFLEPRAPGIDTEDLAAECDGARRDNQYLVRGSTKDGNVLGQVLEPDAIQFVLFVDQQARADLHDQPTKIL